jgi:type IV secretory pathway VirB3-like protein
MTGLLKLKTMETLFVITHAIMLICILGLIYVSASGAIETAKPITISSLVSKVKSPQINTAYFYRAATTLLALFLRS